ncbi:hypothetical protein AVEN_185665-1 [Araneus ventricosus]|uniref:Uncharacterized protein n=1 Tax=Araneus ventricosus TaxID=182803 RepID=A0A4Y2FSY7_ARAVE|nr:hypothetical protein AVEN_185665-1 [Araneus ventricosus]
MQATSAAPRFAGGYNNGGVVVLSTYPMTDILIRYLSMPVNAFKQQDVGIPVMKAGFNVDCAKSGGRRIALTLCNCTQLRLDQIRCVLLATLLGTLTLQVG